MFTFSGASYESGMAGIDGSSSSVVKATVGTRSALTCTAASGITRAIWMMALRYQAAGSVGLAADTHPRAMVIDAWLAVPTLSFADGATRQILTCTMGDLAGSTGGVLYIYLNVARSGATYSLNLTCRPTGSTVSEVFTFGAVSAGTTFHRVTAWIFRDSISYQYDGGAVTTTAFASALTAAPYPAFPSMVWTGAECVAAWDALRIGVEEYPLGSTLGESTTNGCPDNGVIYLIEKTALAGLVTAGTAYELAVTAGAFTEAATADKDYLLIKVGADNDSGYAVKLNKAAGGAVTKSAWSLT